MQNILLKYMWKYELQVLHKDYVGLCYLIDLEKIRLVQN